MGKAEEGAQQAQGGEGSKAEETVQQERELVLQAEERASQADERV